MRNVLFFFVFWGGNLVLFPFRLLRDFLNRVVK
jgi:hypothetical protein